MVPQQPFSSNMRKRSVGVAVSASENTDTESIATTMRFDSWAPELINGRCAMLGYVAGYGYEAVTNESFLPQAHQYWWAFVVVSVLVTIATLQTGRPTKESVSINGLTLEAELFNGRAAMVGFACTLIYELSTRVGGGGGVM